MHDGVKACRSCGYTGMTELRVACIDRKRKYENAARVVAKIVYGMRKRCENVNTPAYANYGGRGIKFAFDSSEAAVTYILAELGPRPTNQHSIDRVDVDGDYAPGNLRWADRTMQRFNQRPHKRRTPDGQRIAKLKEMRPEFSYETLRQYVKRGLTDQEILEREKGKHYGTFKGQNLRYRQLRAEAPVRSEREGSLKLIDRHPAS